MCFHLQTENEIKTAIKDRREQLLGENGGGQPLLVIVGPSISDVKSVLVSVATLRYKVEGVLEGLDLFFKCFHSFHISYPKECYHVLVTLQRAIYSFKTTYDDHIQHSWIKSCSC